MVAIPFNNLITFSRGSNATVTGSNGLIQWAPNNLLTFSEQFDNANWLKLAGGTGVAPVVTANTGVAPDGTTTADRVVFNRGAGTTSSDTSRIFQDVPDPSNGVGTVSFYVRSTDGTSSYTMLIEAGFGNQQITVTGSWQRFSVTSTSSSLNAILGTAGNISAQSVDVLVWGGQTEIGSTATTYNPTTVKNLLGFSEAFDNAGWTKTRASIVTGAQANPINGLFNAQKLMEDTTATNTHRVNSGTVTVATGSTVTVSVYVKAAGRTWCRIADGGVTASGAYVNLATGQFGTISAGVTRSSIVSIGDGWYRVSITGVLSGSLSQLFVDLATGDNVNSYTGDGNSGVYIYGAQLSDSASLDPYVPTPGAAPSSTAFYGPRFDFDPVTLQPRGLLVEEQRTNLALRSDDFSASGTWPTGNVTVTSNSTTAPDGTLTADTVAATTTGTFRYIYQSVTLTNAVTYTLTVYLKYKTARYVWLLGETSGDAFAVFDLLTGTVGSVTAGVTRSITPVGNGWYRCSATFTVSSATGPQQVGFGLSDTDTVANPPATAGIDTFAWGAQLEAGAFATSYIPTVASTVTRSADVATITGQNFAQWFGPATGTFVAEYQAVAGVSMDIAMTSDGSPLTNSLGIFSSNGTSDVGWCRTGGVNQALITASSTATAPHKTAFAYEVNNFGFSAAGSAAGTDTSGTIPTVNIIRLGSIVGGGVSGNTQAFWFRSFNFIPARAADFQLQALTAQAVVDYFFLQTAAGDQLVAGNDDYLYSLPIFG